MTPHGQFHAVNRLPSAAHLHTQPGVLRASRRICGRWRADWTRECLYLPA